MNEGLILKYASSKSPEGRVEVMSTLKVEWFKKLFASGILQGNVTRASIGGRKYVTVTRKTMTMMGSGSRELNMFKSQTYN
jgi:hypothetical protein